MAETVKVTCDAPGCDQEKGETNRWWGIRVLPKAELNGPAFYQEPWSLPHHGRSYDYTHDACSENCASKIHAQWMQMQGQK